MCGYILLTLLHIFSSLFYIYFLVTSWENICRRVRRIYVWILGLKGLTVSFLVGDFLIPAVLSHLLPKEAAVSHACIFVAGCSHIRKLLRSFGDKLFAKRE